MMGNTNFPGLIVKVDEEGKLQGNQHCRAKSIAPQQLSFSDLPLSRTGFSITSTDYIYGTFVGFVSTKTGSGWGSQLPAGNCGTAIPACPSYPLAVANPTHTKNYILTQTPRTEISDQNPVFFGLNARDLDQQIVYFDGLGRPIQQIGIQNSPKRYEVVFQAEYDAFGRVPKEYLPHTPVVSTFGGFQNDPAADRTTFYSTQFPAYGTNRLFTEHLFENSPYNREVEMAPPGDPWVSSGTLPGGEREANEHTLIQRYLVNDINIEILQFPVDASATATALFYGDGELSLSWTEDENGSVTISFSDKLGRIVCQGRQVDGTTSGWIHYIYNAFGQIKYVLPPEALKAIVANGNTLSQAILDSWCFQYKYDQYQRVIEKKVPGAGWMYMVYDNLDRLIMTQDGNQGNGGNEWVCTKYDKLSRPVITGIYIASGSGGSTASRDHLQDIVDDYYALPANQNYVIPDGQGAHYYSETAFPPIIGIEVHSVTYFDNYDFNQDGIADETYVYEPEIVDNEPNQRLFGQITAVKSRVLDYTPEKFLWTVTFYDEYGREIQTLSDHLHSRDITTYQVNFVGEVEKSVHQHQGPNASEVLTEKNFCYDHTGRLIRLSQQINEEPEMIVAKYVYDELGRQSTKYLHSANGGMDYLQTVNQSFNIRGWLTDINSPTTAQAVDQPDLFQMSLSYEQSFPFGVTNNAQYNGNISGISWSYLHESDNQAKTHSYSFRYDGMNRLLSGYFASDDGSQNWNIHPNRYSLSSITYDLNGNILDLRREGKTGSGTYATLDNLSYTYDPAHGNRLLSVSDVTTHPPVPDVMEFIDGNTQGSDYTYDANGNVIQDLNKSITSISYNYLNKPTTITFSNGHSISYVYDASGAKLQQIVSDGSTMVNDYIHGYQYKDQSLLFFGAEEGRMVYDGTDFRYELNLSDHLGNTRLTFADVDEDGSIDINTEILQTNDYYPFGMSHAKDVNLVASPSNDYQYNGKELQDELGLNWYDYGARMYNPAIGRWNGVDPQSEKYTPLTPYDYVGANPMIRIDPNGEDWILEAVLDHGENYLAMFITFKASIIRTGNGVEVDLEAFRQRVIEQIESRYTILGQGSIAVITTAEITIIDDISELEDDAHLIEVIDMNHPNADGSKNHPINDVWRWKWDGIGSGKWERASVAEAGLAATEHYGKRIYVNSNYANKVVNGEEANLIAHEVGHTAGLKHPDDHGENTPREQRIPLDNYYRLANDLMTSRSMKMHLNVNESCARPASELQMRIIHRNLVNFNGTNINSKDVYEHPSWWRTQKPAGEQTAHFGPNKPRWKPRRPK